MHIPYSRAMKRLEKDLATVTEGIEKCETDVEECDKEMKELKVVLYAKFGRAINLDE